MKTSRSAAAKKKQPARKSARSRSRIKPKSKTKTRRTKTAARKKPAAKKQLTKKPAARKPAAKKTAVRKKPAAAKTATSRPSPPKATPRPTKPAAPPVAPLIPANETKIGVVTHYYSHLNVAVVAVIARGMQVGDRIHLKGYTTDFYQTVASMEIDHQPVTRAQPGQTVGLKVNDHARDHDGVYLVT